MLKISVDIGIIKNNTLKYPIKLDNSLFILDKMFYRQAIETDTG